MAVRVRMANERPRAALAGGSRHSAYAAVLKNRVLQVTMVTDVGMFTSMEDRALLDAAKHLVIDEHFATAALLRALMEIDTRRLYLGEGCASMFNYCTQVLHLAEGAAYNRIEAARAARRYPLILELFEQGAITLTAVRLLAPHLTAENHVAVLTSATHKLKREIEELVCALKPRPDAPIVVRRLPTLRAVLVQPKASVPSAPSATRVGPTSSAVDCRRERCADARAIDNVNHPARARTLSDSAHRLARDPRQVPACPGTAASRAALGGLPPKFSIAP